MVKRAIRVITHGQQTKEKLRIITKGQQSKNGNNQWSSGRTE
jgi:hypothetical protein